MIVVTLALFASVPGLMLFALSVAFTFAHTVEEMGAVGVPFWEYAADLTRIRLSWWLGFVLFVGLAAALVAVAYVAYFERSAAALALLVGLRAGDAITSHGLLSVVYKKENPGLATIPLYLCELVIVGVLWREIQAEPFRAGWFVVGFSVFALPWTLLLLLRRLARR